jgi:hypothetical protein
MKRRGYRGIFGVFLAGAVAFLTSCASAPEIGKVSETPGSQGYSTFETTIAHRSNPDTAELMVLKVTYDQKYQRFDFDYFYRDPESMNIQSIVVMADDATFEVTSGSPMRYDMKKKGVRYEVEKDACRAEIDDLRLLAGAGKAMVTLIGKGGEIEFVIDRAGQQAVGELVGIYDKEVKGSGAAIMKSVL